jgi:adenylate cyclase
VNTGLAVVGDFGSDSVPNYCAAGRTAELAGEIEQLSANYGAAILVGEATRAMAESKFAFLEVDIVGSKSGERTPLFALLGTPVSRANPKFLALKESHERVFEAYRAGEWERARALIAQCRPLSGANPMLYDLYLKRIDHMESQPPVQDWNGVFNPLIVG